MDKKKTSQIQYPISILFPYILLTLKYILEEQGEQLRKKIKGIKFQEIFHILDH